MNPYHTSNRVEIGGTILEGECPKCRRHYRGHPATSRVDNKTKICPDCGLKEAVEAFKKGKNGSDS